MPTVAAIVPTVGDADLLRRCLGGLSRQERPPDEVVVVCSGAPAPALGASLPLRVVELPQRVHFGEAVNRGLEESAAGELLILNDDTVPLPGLVGAMLAARRQGGLALYQPRILLDGAAARLDNAGHGLFPDGFNWARGREAPDGARFDVPGTVGAVSGAAFWAPRAVLTRIGRFDEAFEAFGEDLDLSLRAVRRGFPLRYVPEAQVRHRLGATYGRYGARKVYLVERNRVRAAVRSLPATAVATLPLWTALRWGALGAAAATGRGWGARLDRRARVAALGGALAGLAHLPDAWRKRRADAADWQIGELGMWRHLLRERVRARDLFGGEPGAIEPEAVPSESFEPTRLRRGA